MSDEQPPTVTPPPGSGPFAFPPLNDEPRSHGSPRAFYPLNFDSILRTAGSMFRFAWRPLLGASLIPHVIVYVFLVPLSALASPRFNDWAVAYEDALRHQLPIPPLPEGLQPLLLLLALVTIGSLLAGLIVSAAVVHIGDSVFRGRPVTLRGALGTALRRTPSLIGAQLLVLLAAVGVVLLGFVFGAILFVGGGLAAFLALIAIVGSFAALFFLVVRWALLVETVVVEKSGPVEGLSRSWRLVSGSGWRVLGYLIALVLIGFLLQLALSALPQAILRLDPMSTSGAAIGAVLDGLAAVLIAPIAPLVMLFLYYDLRHKAGEAAPQPGEDRPVAKTELP